ncbi:MAG TPA: amidase [Nocardioidaceae bacterium]|jgi:aspartyl-tRNA(Asn)/glutamyl-tRNA(Gln) amidotransferase subunit A
MTTTATSAPTATELLDAYRAGSLSPVEATEDSLARIADHDGGVNAFCLVDAEAALTQARASEERWRRGEPCGPLDGVPTAIKDIFLTRGWPTLRGSRLVDPGQDWAEDAPSTARLREAGAVLVGKTTTPEFAWKGVTDSALTGVTRNPWDPALTAGGSSGGAGAAVAAGMCPLATGTDGGGSVRIPGSFCGVFALKPTYGRIPLFPPSPFGTLSHAGPMTWTVRDAALMTDVMSRPDSRDWSQLPPPERSFLDGLEDGVAGLRIAFSPALGYVDVDPEVAAAVRSAVGVFAELGARVEEVDPGFDDPLEAFDVLWYAGLAKVLEGYPAERRTEVEPAVVEVAALGEGYSATDYLEAVAQRMALGVRMGAFHETYDLLLTPTTPIAAFEAGREVPPGWPHERWQTWTPFTYPFNLTQQPAATVPCGFTSAGLPVGLQVVGPRHADARVLRACRAFEQARPWAGTRPTLGVSEG